MKKAQYSFNHIKPNFITNTVKVDCIYSAFEANYKPDFTYIGEFHPYWEFVYVLSGSVCASGDERIYRLNAGDMIFHKPMEFHRIWAVDNIPPHIFIMSFSLDGETANKLENNVFTLTDNQKTKLMDLFNYLKEDTSYSTNDHNVTYFLKNWADATPQNIANRLEAFLLTFENNDELILKKEYSYGELKVYKQILNILSENVHTWITLDDIAKQCNISKSQLKRLFAANSPTAIHKYFIRLKIVEAITLLLSGLSVVETSEKLEFSSPNYFSTVFKRETGMSPLDYKRNNRLV